MKLTTLLFVSLVLILLGISFLFYRNQCKLVREGHNGRRGARRRHIVGGGRDRYWRHGRRYNQYYGGNYSGWGDWSPLILYYYIYPQDDYDYNYAYVPADDRYGVVPVVSSDGPTPVYRYYPWM